jgi:hypothetical protein
MKSRAIALGASVIALTLANGGQAVASGVGDLGGNLKVQTEASVSGPAGTSAEVEGALKVPAKVPAKVPSKGSVEDVTRRPDRPNATVEAKQRSGHDRSEVVLGLDSDGVSAYVDQRRKGQFELEAAGQAGPRHAESSVTGFSRRAGKAGGQARVHAPKVKRAATERSIRKHSRKIARNEALSTPGGRDKAPTPLQAIGREVGNPIQLSLAGWLIALTAAGGLAASRMVRRLHRTS